MTCGRIQQTVCCLLFPLTVATWFLSPFAAGAQGSVQPDSAAEQRSRVAAIESALTAEALPDSLRRLLADIEPKLAPVQHSSGGNRLVAHVHVGIFLRYRLAIPVGPANPF